MPSPYTPAHAAVTAAGASGAEQHALQLQVVMVQLKVRAVRLAAGSLTTTFRTRHQPDRLASYSVTTPYPAHNTSHAFPCGLLGGPPATKRFWPQVRVLCITWCLAR